MIWYAPVPAEPFEWDINRGYKAFEYVEHEEHWYICKWKSLPPGIDIHDEKYWYDLGSINTIESYK